MDELQRELNSDEENLETFLKLEQQFIAGDTFTDLVHDAILTESDLPENCNYSVLSSYHLFVYMKYVYRMVFLSF
jgi:hypothetical protein